MKKRSSVMIAICLFIIPCCFSQNIGIGTATPLRAKLELNGSVGNTTAIFGGETTGIGLIAGWPEVGFNGYYNNGQKYIDTGFAAFQTLDPVSGYMAFDMCNYGYKNALMPVATRALTLSPNGYVGINGASPNAELQLPNTINNRKLVLWETNNNDHEFYGLGIQSGTLTYNIASASNVHRFYAGDGSSQSTLLMSIWGNKQILLGTSAGGTFAGINTDASSHTLTVRQAANTGLCLVEAASGNTWGLDAFYLGSTGYTSMEVKLNDNYVGEFYSNGVYHASDRRIKNNIQAMPSLLDKVMKLQPKKYELKYNNPMHDQSIGFIAQDVKTLFPELVVVRDGVKEGNEEFKDFHCVNYDGFGVIAIKAIQEQQQEIELLKREVSELKKLSGANAH